METFRKIQINVRSGLKVQTSFQLFPANNMNIMHSKQRHDALNQHVTNIKLSCNSELVEEQRP